MTATTLQVNDNEDLFLPDGRNLVILSGISACEQNVRQATKLRKGENQFNINEGVDYIGTVFTPVPDYDAFRASLSANIKNVPDVIDIQSLTITQTGNDLDYVANIITVYGLTTAQGL